MFRPSDHRRVQAELDALLPAPYEAEVTLADERQAMNVLIRDPDEPGLTVAACTWRFDPARKNEKQPSPEELAAVVQNLAIICEAYPEAKAANQADYEARVARQEANLEARAEDARIEAEKALKSAAARVLGAAELTSELIDAVDAAASNPALD